MKHLKRFLESRFQSEEEVSDHLLELIDDGFISLKKLNFKKRWDSSGNIVTGADILYAYQISDRFKKINSIEELETYTNNLSELYKIIKRWKLNFIIIQDEITIEDQSPEYISEFIINNPNLMFHYSISGHRSPGWSSLPASFRGGSPSLWFSIYFTHNLEFFITLKGKRPIIENYLKNRLVYGEKYQLKLTKESQTQVEYQIIPSK